jgi:hypothetical protein
LLLEISKSQWTEMGYELNWWGKYWTQIKTCNFFKLENLFRSFCLDS